MVPPRSERSEAVNGGDDMRRKRKGKAEVLEVATRDCAGIDIGKDTHTSRSTRIGAQSRCDRSTPSRQTSRRWRRGRRPAG